MLRLPWILPVLFIGVLVGTEARTQETWAVKNVNIVPMDTERTLLQHTLIVSGKTIVRIGPSESTEIPSDIKIIDGQGKFLMPGLADMSVGLEDPSDIRWLWSFLAEGVTAIRIIGGTNAHLKLRNGQAAGEVPSLNIQVISPPVFLRGGRDKSAFECALFGCAQATSSKQARAAVRKFHRLGYDYALIRSGFSADTSVFEDALSEAKRQGIAAVGNSPWEVMWPAFEAGLNEVTRMGGLQSRRKFNDDDLDYFRSHDVCFMPFLTSAVTGLDIERAAGIRLGDWEVNLDAVKISNLHLVLEGPEFRVLTSDQKLELRDKLLSIAVGATSFTELNYAIKVRAAQLYGTHVKLLAASNAFDTYGRMPGHIHAELAAMVEEVGMTPFEALSTATLNPAECSKKAGLNDWSGLIAEGLRADFIMLEENPLANIRAASRPVGASLAGRWYWEKDLETAIRPDEQFPEPK